MCFYYNSSFDPQEEMGSKFSTKDNPALKYLGVIIVLLLCLSIVVDVVSFKRLSLLPGKSTGVELGSAYNEGSLNLTKNIDDIFR